MFTLAFLSRMSWYIFPFILPPSCSHLQPSLSVWCVWMHVLWHLVSSEQIMFSQCFKGFKWASTCFFFNNGSLHGERAYRPWPLNALLIGFFGTVVPTNPYLSKALHKWSLVLGQLFSFVRNLARSTWSWPFYVEIMFFPLPNYAPTVLTGKLRSLEILL